MYLEEGYAQVQSILFAGVRIRKEIVLPENYDCSREITIVKKQNKISEFEICIKAAIKVMKLPPDFKIKPQEVELLRAVIFIGAAMFLII